MLALLAAWLLVYQAPAWQHFTERLALADTPTAQALAALRNLILPVFCTALGLIVAIARPTDRRAWLLLAFLLAYAETSREATDLSRRDDWLRLPAFWYNELAEQSWAIWLFLFALAFPNSLPFGRRSWIVGALIVPVAVIAVLASLRKLHVGPAERWLLVLGPTVPAVAFAFTAIVIALLGARYLATTSKDDRRRLRLLYWGCVIGVGPQLALLLLRAVTGRSITDLAGTPTVVVAEVLTSLLPLTLAYVVLVDRALDVRIVVREGLQYALARHGIVAVQVVLTVGALVVSITMADQASTTPVRRTALIGCGLALVFLVRRLAESLRVWIDRRFYREVWRAEQVLRVLATDVRTMIRTLPLLERVAQSIAGSLHVPRVVMLVCETGGFRIAYALGCDPAPGVLVDAGAPWLAPFRVNPHAMRVEAVAAEALAPLAPEVLLPLHSSDQLLGLVCLGPKRADQPYSPSDLQMLESVALPVGLALQNSLLSETLAAATAQRERLERELEFAREVQERLLPQSVPRVTGLDCAAAYRPARGVGGDYYDFLELSNGRIGIAIGDVSGKGVAAALLMASLEASLRSQTLDGDYDVRALMGRLNRLIFDATGSNRYATFFYAEYDPRSRSLTGVNAGHNPPLLFKEDGELIHLDDGGPALGLFPDATYQHFAVALELGDRLVAFTDGISEAMNLADEEWTEGRLIETVRHAESSLPAEAIVQAIVSAVRAYTGAAPQHDDSTLLVLRLTSDVGGRTVVERQRAGDR